MRNSWLTTMFGFMLAGATTFLTTATAQASRTATDIARIVQALGAAGLGASAADDRKLNGKTTRTDQWPKYNSPPSSGTPAKKSAA